MERKADLWDDLHSEDRRATLGVRMGVIALQHLENLKTLLSVFKAAVKFFTMELNCLERLSVEIFPLLLK